MVAVSDPSSRWNVTSRSTVFVVPASRELPRPARCSGSTPTRWARNSIAESAHRSPVIRSTDRGSSLAVWKEHRSLSSPGLRVATTRAASCCAASPRSRDTTGAAPPSQRSSDLAHRAVLDGEAPGGVCALVNTSSWTRTGAPNRRASARPSLGRASTRRRVRPRCSSRYAKNVQSTSSSSTTRSIRTPKALSTLMSASWVPTRRDRCQC